MLEAKGFTAADFRNFHPGGKLGARLSFVRDIMHKDQEIPLIALGAHMDAAVLEMTGKRFGCVCVVDDAGMQGASPEPSYNDNVERLLVTFDLLRRNQARTAIITGGGGGFDTGRTVTDNCFVVDSPQQKLNCHVAPPFSGNTQIKLNGSVPLPAAFFVSALYQNLSGPSYTAEYAATTQQIAPSLGRDLSGGARTATVAQLVHPVERPQEGGLAAAGRADAGRDMVGPHGHRHAVQRLRGSVPEVDVGGDEFRGVGHHRERRMGDRASNARAATFIRRTSISSTNPAAHACRCQSS